MGIGSELNGDDAVGVRVLQRLKSQLNDIPSRILLIEACSMPENFTGAIRKFKPDEVILVDAAGMSLDPGEIRWLHSSEINGVSALSHTLPLSVLATYLESEMGCKVTLLGIQPYKNEFDTPLSLPVENAVDKAVDFLLQYIWRV